ncbi:MAG: ubiquinol-cytochrome c reductase iron-sulfur subunit [Vicinamibacterales bacterium]
MTTQTEPVESMGRRNFFVRIITAVHAVMGATLTFIVGGAILSPSFKAREVTWLPAGDVGTLKDNEPLAVTLRVSRQDGYAQVVDRRVVYLVRTDGGDVRAMDSTCTHLGCRTSYDADTGLIRCPCHGGVFTPQGQVVDGPPPEPLRTLPTRVDNGQIMVQV